MQRIINKIFNDEGTISKIKAKLPYLFQLAEVDCSRDWKLWMEIWSARERILVALLIHLFWTNNVNTEIPITENEIDVEVYNIPLSIKTATGRNITWFKLIWTSDNEKVVEFIENYTPSCDILYAHINRDTLSWWLYLLRKEWQLDIFNEMWNDLYLKKPTPGTNSRWVEISKEALNKVILHETTKKIPITWRRNENINYNAYDRRVDLWNEDQ